MSEDPSEMVPPSQDVTKPRETPESLVEKLELKFLSDARNRFDLRWSRYTPPADSDISIEERKRKMYEDATAEMISEYARAIKNLIPLEVGEEIYHLGYAEALNEFGRQNDGILTLAEDQEGKAFVLATLPDGTSEPFGFTPYVLDRYYSMKVAGRFKQLADSVIDGEVVERPKFIE